MTYSPEQLRQIYEGDYVDRFTAEDDGRLARLMPLMYLSPNDLVVDLACGNGLMLDFLRHRVATYTGVDFSERFIAAARARQVDSGTTTAEFVADDIVHFSAQHPAAFTVALAMDFAEHVYDQDFIHIFRAVRRSLRPGGRLYLHTPNANFFLEKLKKIGLIRSHPEHIGVRTGAEYMRLLEEVGFSQVTVHEIAHYVPVLSWLHPLGRLPWLGRFFRARLFIECS